MTTIFYTGPELIKNLNKCRTCGRYFVADANAKDLYDQENIVILYHIEVITGVWIKRQNGLPQHMCSSCISDLRRAIQFREGCVRAEVELRHQLREEQPKNYQTDDSETAPPSDIDEIENNYKDCKEFFSTFEAAAAANKAVKSESPKGIASKYSSASELNIAVVDAPATNDLSEFLIIKPNDSDVKVQIEPHSTQIMAIDDSADAECKRHCNDPLEMESSEPNLEDLLKEIQRKKPPIDVSKSRNLGEQLFNNLLNLDDPATRPMQKYRRFKTKEERDARDRERRRRNKRVYVCEQCGRRQNGITNFKMHMMRHSGIKDIQCPECPRKFYDNYMMKIHQRVVHKGEKPYSCKYCPATFNNCSTRYIHAKKHGSINSTSIICNYCGKTFFSAQTLKWHVNKHTGAKPFQCRTCDKSYPHPVSLKNHEKTHIAKEYVCEICLQSFHQRFLLIEHQIVHTGGQRYRCEVCNVSVRQRWYLKSHNQTKLHKENLLNAAIAGKEHG